MRKAKEPTWLDEELQRAQRRLSETDFGAEDYANCLAYVERLREMQIKEKSDHVSKEIWATIGANLLGIVLIIGHERVHVVSANALRMVTKLR